MIKHNAWLLIRRPQGRIDIICYCYPSVKLFLTCKKNECYKEHSKIKVTVQLTWKSFIPRRHLLCNACGCIVCVVIQPTMGTANVSCRHRVSYCAPAHMANVAARRVIWNLHTKGVAARPIARPGTQWMQRHPVRVHIQNGPRKS